MLQDGENALLANLSCLRKTGPTTKPQSTHLPRKFHPFYWMSLERRRETSKPWGDSSELCPHTNHMSSHKLRSLSSQDKVNPKLFKVVKTIDQFRESLFHLSCPTSLRQTNILPKLNQLINSSKCNDSNLRLPRNHLRVSTMKRREKSFAPQNPSHEPMLQTLLKILTEWFV